MMKKLSLTLPVVLLGCMLSSVAFAAAEAAAGGWKSKMHWKPKMPELSMPTYDHWYLRADLAETQWRGNAGMINNQLPNGTNTDMAPYWDMTREGGLGLGVGMGWSHHLRTDFTMTQTRFSTADAQNVAIRNGTSGDLMTRARARSTLFNLYWDLGHFVRPFARHRIEPYIGGGLGGSYNTMNGITEYSPGTSNVIAHIPGHSNWAPAFQYGAGLAYKLYNSPLSIDLSYMYLNAGRVKSTSQMDIHSSSQEQLIHPTTLHLRGDRWMLGLRWCM